MEWRAEVVLLSVRRHGETAAIIEVFSAEHGRYAGVVRGGASRKMTPHLQLGAQLDATWRARLSEHLGSFTVEPRKGRAADVMQDRFALAGLNAVCALLCFTLPEREAHPSLYARSIALLDGLGASHWAEAYINWELALLEELGFGLDLSQCAVTGATQDLVFVSPRTGRAVARGAAGEWEDKLLELPKFLQGSGPATPQDLTSGLRLTGHFLETRVAPALGERNIPSARARLVDLLARQV